MAAEKKLESINRFIATRPSVLVGILVITTLILTTLVMDPEKGSVNLTYRLADVADRDIKAPRDFFIEDTEATELNRTKTGQSVLTVYDFDPTLIQKISDRLNHSFALTQKFYSNGEETPSLSTVMAVKEEFERTMGLTINKGAFTTLHRNDFSPGILEKTQAILTAILENGVVSNKEILLKEEGKGIVLRTLGTTDERVINNLKVFYGPDQAKAMVRIIGDPLLKEIDYNLSNLIVDLCQQLLIPNITMNRSETEARVQAAESEVKPVLYKIKAGEMILREGERVDELQLVKLKALEGQTDKKNFLMARSGTVLVILFLLVVVYILLLRDKKILERHHNKNIIFLASLLILFAVVASLAAPFAARVNLDLPVSMSDVSISLGLPLAAGAMTVCLFLNFGVAISFSIVLSLVCSMIFSNSIEVFIFFFLSSITAAFWTKECRQRKRFITAGVKLALFNSSLALVLNIYSGQPDIGIISKEILLAFSGGLLAGIFTAGLAPLIEILFDYTTEIKLLELASLDQPIMRRLMIEAPGTYNHSIIVASLAEAAASAIGASILKTKVSAFYHDIGKLQQPLYFIENQTDGKNRHDKLSPSMSALILIQHVKKGVEIAKEYKLGTDIIDTIRQHHGTSLIRYFYNKSVKINGPDTVKESDFRYPGPKPQTREAGIVMLADVIEAAMRTLERPTPARIQGRVQELTNAIFSDGQLEECELTLKDLHQIARSFIKILTGIYHQRIEYAERPQENKPQEKQKEKNGTQENPDPNSDKQDKTVKTPDRPKAQQNLKRLGI
ncbi:MAG: HDIG domain-containing protein [Desulfobacterium sp.]|jgi:putative nucleotidyltransferase with HDIG domain|nr:HDIG domain-containing protein [Desulfobacterium sp.]